MVRVFFANDFIKKKSVNNLIFICDHATNYIPKKFKQLGITDNKLKSHIAYDIGAKTLTLELGKKLNQSCFLSNFSRLLIDPNRSKTDRDLIIQKSFGTKIPGNLNISPEDRKNRIKFYYNSYHRNLAYFVKQKIRKFKRVSLISIHSFTKKSKNINRGIEVGLLWNKNMNLLLPIQKILLKKKIHFGRNYPYSGFYFNHTLDKLNKTFSLDNITIEIRNDLICHEKGIKKYVDLFSNIFKDILNDY